MSHKNRRTNNRKRKLVARRRRRKKQSKLFAAIVIELIAAVALFGAYQSARDIRASQRADQAAPSVAEQIHPEHVQTPSPWNRLAAAVSPAPRSSEAPVFRPSRLLDFMPEGS